MSLGDNCRERCQTRDHRSFGDCVRAAGIQWDLHSVMNSSAEKDKDARLSRYEDARHQGLQPRNTTWDGVRSAFETGGIAETPVTPTAVSG